MNDNNDIFSLDDHTDNKLLIDETEVSDQPKSIRDVKKIFWANAIARCNKERADSGITVGKWCIKNNLSIRSYWYYHKKISDELANKALINKEPLSETSFLQFNKSSFPSLNSFDNHSIILHTGKASIEITEDISDSFY